MKKNLHRIILVSITILLVAVFYIFNLIDTYWATTLPYLISSIIIISIFNYSYTIIFLYIMLPVFLISLAITLNTSLTCDSWAICFDRTLVASGFSKLFLILTILIILSKSLYLWIVSRRNKI